MKRRAFFKNSMIAGAAAWSGAMSTSNSYFWDKGFRGFLGLEHKPKGAGKEGNLAVLKAYQEVDPK